MKNSIRKIFISLGVVVLLVLAFIVYLSPQETAPFRDENGVILPNSIAEVTNITLNGVSQRLVVRGKDQSNPVLLHIHGGPGFPNHPFIQEGDADLEDIFTVCYWEQRGAGASFSEEIPASTMTLAQIAKDGVQLSQYLIKRFKKEKIYLQGHSWGTMVGATLASDAPELYHAYIGIGQMANSQLSEQISYDYALSEAKKAGDQEGITILDKMGRPPYATDKEWLGNVMPERTIMRKYENPKGKPPKSLLDFYKLFISYKEYSISDKLKIAKGEYFSMQTLWMENINSNLFESIPAYNIPVYIIQGKYDKHTVTEVARSYFDSLKAPIKQYFELENSGHDPHVEEFEKYRKIMIEEVLK